MRHRRVARGPPPQRCCFVWFRNVIGSLSFHRAQFDAQVFGLPRQRIGLAGVITLL